MSASPFMVWHWIKDRDPANIGAYVDFEHMSTETTPTSRVMALDLLGKRVNAVAVKDFRWRLEPASDTAGQHEEMLTLVRVPVGQGVVPWAEMFEYIRLAGADPLVSVHSEYRLPSSWQVLNTADLIEQTMKDVDFVRHCL
jgi:sugar phosphate isomerase/epimerase